MEAVRIRLVLIDASSLVLEAVADRFSREPGFHVLGTAADAETGFRLATQTKPDIVLLDVDLPGAGSFNLAEDLGRRLPETVIVFLTSHVSDVFLDEALRVKGAGYLLKEEPFADVVQHLRAIRSGERRFSAAAAARLEQNPDSGGYRVRATNELSSLTSRQLEVLRHLAKGESVKEVARTMHLSEKSVDSHKYRIMNKLGIHDRVQLALYAVREGLMLP